MHTLVSKGHFCRGPFNLGSNMLSCLFVTVIFFFTKPNICAKFERNRWLELYHLLPGFLTGHTLWKAGWKPPLAFSERYILMGHICTVDSNIQRSTKKRDTRQAKSPCSQVCEWSLPVRSSPRRTIDFPLRHLFSWIFQPEFYWLSKEMIFFFFSGQYLNIKRLDQ